MAAMSRSDGKKITRHDLIAQIREEGGEGEQTEILIDYIQELWETIDLLQQRFGKKRTQEIVEASSPPYLLADF